MKKHPKDHKETFDTNPGNCGERVSKKKIHFWRGIFIFFLLVFMGTGLGLVSLYFGAAYYLMPMFKSYFSVAYLVLLNVFPVVWLMVLLYLVFNRIWLSFLSSALVTLGLSLVNYSKLMIRNDPLIGMDLRLFFESLNMAGEFSLPLDYKIVLVMGTVLLGTVFFVLFFQGPDTLRQIERAVSCDCGSDRGGSLRARLPFRGALCVTKE